MAAPADEAPPVVDEEPEMTAGYVPPEKVATKDLMEKDKDDESLTKWKQQLVSKVVESDDPQNVRIMELALISGNNELAYPLSDEDAVKAMTAKPLIVKEGVDYRLRVRFKINHEIVVGFKYFHVVKKGPIPLEKKTMMMGSFGPDAEVKEFLMPEDTAPSGMMGRGTYTVNSKFMDDDKNVHLAWSWTLQVAKDWA